MNNLKKCLIFTGGDFDFAQSVQKFKSEDCFIICADKGYDYAIECGFHPSYLIGDLDSIAEKSNFECEVLTFPKEKDDTDTMLAIKLALQNGFDDIKIFGALGGRLDHTFANIQALAFLCEHNAKAEFFSDTQKVTMISPSTISVEKDDFDYLSLFSYSPKCEGLCLNGVKYPLENGEISNNFPIGISNEITENIAQISFSKGKLLIIQSKN